MKKLSDIFQKNKTVGENLNVIIQCNTVKYRGEDHWVNFHGCSLACCFLYILMTFFPGTIPCDRPGLLFLGWDCVSWHSLELKSGPLTAHWVVLFNSCCLLASNSSESWAKTQLPPKRQRPFLKFQQIFLPLISFTSSSLGASFTCFSMIDFSNSSASRNGLANTERPFGSDFSDEVTRNGFFKFSVGAPIRPWNWFVEVSLSDKCTNSLEKLQEINWENSTITHHYYSVRWAHRRNWFF